MIGPRNCRDQSQSIAENMMSAKNELDAKIQLERYAREALASGEMEGFRVEDFRSLLGLDIAELAEILDVSPRAVYNWQTDGVDGVHAYALATLGLNPDVVQDATDTEIPVARGT